jgi:hypothetical protein
MNGQTIETVDFVSLYRRAFAECGTRALRNKHVFEDRA